MSEETMIALKKVRVGGLPLSISRLNEARKFGHSGKRPKRKSGIKNKHRKKRPGANERRARKKSTGEKSSGKKPGRKPTG